MLQLPISCQNYSHNINGREVPVASFKQESREKTITNLER